VYIVIFRYICYFNLGSVSSSRSCVTKEDDNILHSNFPAKCASASKYLSMEGVGVSSIVVCYDPTKRDGAAHSQSPFDFLVPGNNDVDIDKLMRNFWDRDCIVFDYDLKGIPETGDRGRGRKVQNDHGEGFCSLLSGSGVELKFSMEKTMKELGVDRGLVTEGSKMDGYFILRNSGIVVGNWEVKGTDSSPEESLRQAFAYGTSIAVHLRKYQYWNDILVPVISSNGYLFQFGAVMMLKPCFPYAITITKVLDARDVRDRKQISIVLWNMKLFFEKLAQSPFPITCVGSYPIGLSLDMYHVKPLSKFFEAPLE
jgi:hypothetical protein